MAKMEDQEINEILQRDKPGFRAITRRSPLRAIASDAPTDAEPGLELHELRKAYLGDAAEVEDDLAAEGGDNGEDDDEITVVEPDQHPGFDAAPGPKTVIISGKERRVIVEQG